MKKPSRIKVQRRHRSLPAGQYRQRCYVCYRPFDRCFCDAIPTVQNRTEVLILQHRRERTHPFNTARIVSQALQRCQLIHDRNDCFAARQLPLVEKAGLLYPSNDAVLLSDLSPESRPSQLVVLDGTWHQAKTLYRDIPQLKALPRYRLAPSTPGQFRIRLEPTPTSLSTLEATVQALQQLEPETEGFDKLLNAFKVMVDQQLPHPLANYGSDEPKPKHYNLNVPYSLKGDLANVVAVYGETMPVDYGSGATWDELQQQKRVVGKYPPVYWVAERLSAQGGISHLFSATLQPATQLSAKSLNYMQLTAEDFADAISVEQFQQQWQDFLQPADTLVAHSHNIIRLLRNAGCAPQRFEVLKSINHDPHGEFRTQQEFFEARSCEVAKTNHAGRGGRRLANAVTMIRYLNSLG